MHLGRRRRRVGASGPGRAGARAAVGVSLALGLLVIGPASTRADVAPEARCRDAKGKATGTAALGILKAFGRNEKKPDSAKLDAEVSKAKSKLTQAFAVAEARGGCVTSGDVQLVDGKVDLFVAEVIAALGSGTASTTTTTSGGSTTTTTSPPSVCDSTAPPTCGGACPSGLGCGNVGLGECRCLPPGTPCGDAAFPACGGVCPTPIGGFCLPSVGDTCACQ